MLPYTAAMKWRSSSSVVLPSAGFIEPCIPSPVKRAPTIDDWVYEVKHDGYRLMVRRQDGKVRIYSRRGADFTLRFPRIVDAVRRLRVRSVLLDGEGIVYGHTGLPDFALIHSKEYDREASLIAFDLLELDGIDFRSKPLLDRKARLTRAIGTVRDGIEFNEHMEGDGSDIFKAVLAQPHNAYGIRIYRALQRPRRRSRRAPRRPNDHLRLR
jgi:ATP-dependent DNA ligase